MPTSRPPRHVSWISTFAPAGLRILADALVGDITPAELAKHPLWKHFSSLLDILDLADFTNRCFYDLKQDGVISEEECQAVVEEIARMSVFPLQEEISARAAADEAEKFIERLGDSHWHAQVEKALETVGGLVLPEPAVQRCTLLARQELGELHGTEYWVRTWNGQFHFPGRRSYETLNLIESVYPGGFNTNYPEEAVPKIAAAARAVRTRQGCPSLILCVDRGVDNSWEEWPHESWVRCGTKLLRKITIRDIFMILSKAQFRQ